MSKKPPVTILGYDKVPLSKLKTFPGNPRRGDIGAIADSLKLTGQYKPIVVRKSDMTILVGNHTYEAAKLIKLKSLDVCFVECKSDAIAKRVVAVDNRMPELGGYDEQALAEFLGTMDDLTGTGYTEADLEAITRASSRAAEETLDAIGSLPPSDVTAHQFDGLTLDDVDEDTDTYVPGMEVQDFEADEEESRRKPDAFDKADEEPPGVITLKESPRFPGATYWEIPIIRPDMLIEELPQPLETWAGMATREWPVEDQWWVFNYGSERTHGMRDPSKMILSFYSFDQYFETWWWDTNRNMAKALNTKIKYAIAPNFSQDGEARSISLWQLYRSRYIARYFQEVGIRVMVDIEWRAGDMEYLDKYVCAGLPKKMPYVSIQAQNLWADKHKDDPEAAEAMKKEWCDFLRYFVEKMEPQNLFVYASKPGIELVRSLNLPCGIHWQKTRLLVWQEHGPKEKRQRRTTL